jgi:hypothetical protein
MKKQRKASKILGILSIIFGCLSPIVGTTLGIIGLSIKKNEEKRNRDIILNVIGLVISAINWIIGTIFWMNYFA